MDWYFILEYATTVFITLAICTTIFICARMLIRAWSGREKSKENKTDLAALAKSIEAHMPTTGEGIRIRVHRTELEEIELSAIPARTVETHEVINRSAES